MVRLYGLERTEADIVIVLIKQPFSSVTKEDKRSPRNVFWILTQNLLPQTS